MRHFATESGKSKGQFYTPAEVSRIMAQILGIGQAKTSSDTTVYDPTCGSGSLLLKVADAARTPVTIYGQEKDATTAGLARMNMILHNNPGALIEQGNTLTVPKFKLGETLKTFDYGVANPPFSDKRWSTGLDPLHDPYDRFQPFGTQLIPALSEDLLAHYAGEPLIDKYDVYQHLMDYWAEAMQDDCYLIAADGWKVETYRIIEKDKKGKEKDKGWTCDLVPKALIVAHYFAKEQEAIDKLAVELESVTAKMTELEEEHGGEEGAFSELEQIEQVQRHRQPEGNQGRPRGQG
jgi:methylase of polypeptide subunit release factors